MPKLLTQGVSLEPKNGRQLIGIVAGFKSERWPVIDRNAGRLQLGIRNMPKIAGQDSEFGAAMLLVASEGELLLDRNNNIAGYISSKPRGPHLRLVVSNDSIPE